MRDKLQLDVNATARRGAAARVAAVVLLLAGAAAGEVIDRIALTVDSEVVTESRLREELRVRGFIDGREPVITPETKRDMANRLVEQILIRREMEFARYPDPPAEEIKEQFQQIRARYRTEQEYRAALARHGITEQEVLDKLTRMVALVHFIDLRFRPEVQVLEPEVLEYFNRVCLPAYRKENPSEPVPTFEDLRSSCEADLAAQRVDARVEEWLKEARSRTRIRFEEDAFK